MNFKINIQSKCLTELQMHIIYISLLMFISLRQNWWQSQSLTSNIVSSMFIWVLFILTKINTDYGQINTDHWQINTDQWQINTDQWQINTDQSQINHNHVDITSYWWWSSKHKIVIIMGILSTTITSLLQIPTTATLYLMWIEIDLFDAISTIYDTSFNWCQHKCHNSIKYQSSHLFHRVKILL